MRQKKPTQNTEKKDCFLFRNDQRGICLTQGYITSATCFRCDGQPNLRVDTIHIAQRRVVRSSRYSPRRQYLAPECSLPDSLTSFNIESYQPMDTIFVIFRFFHDDKERMVLESIEGIVSLWNGAFLCCACKKCFRLFFVVLTFFSSFEVIARQRKDY